jgi:hypothetical protein
MLQTTPHAAAQFRLNVSGEFERHAAECRDMARTAHDPACKAAFAWLADALERRAETLDETVWLKHAMAQPYSVPAAHFFR